MRKILAPLFVGLAALTLAVSLAGTATAGVPEARAPVAPAASTSALTANAHFSNWSHTRCGGIGIAVAGSTALGYDYLLYPGRNGIGAAFYSGGPPIQVQHYVSGRWVVIGVFGIGQHRVGDSGYYILIRMDC